MKRESFQKKERQYFSGIYAARRAYADLLRKTTCLLATVQEWAECTLNFSSSRHGVAGKMT
jgi:hypothetical protein